MLKEWISLSTATLIAQTNREKLLRAVQGGAIEGRKNPEGRWEVEHTSLRKFMRCRDADLASAA